ncbi:MAG: ATP synthase F1 subunit gamma [Candidatus Pacebacteria bacterium]|nr:ATP synthase F1 subunit gamma [Candidatus Paceibacterota bacterium]
MALAIRKIKRQIRSVKNTQKITKAMELVSAAKMRRAVSAVKLSRSYADLAWQAVLNLSQKTDPELHLLLTKPKEIKKVGVLVVGSNRGLCGVFNQQLLKKAVAFAASEKEVSSDVAIDFITLGRKAALSLVKAGFNIAADFPKTEIISAVGEIMPLSRMLLDDFLDKKYDKIVLIYTDFISSLRQQPTIKQLLPLVPQSKKSQENGTAEYIFEPDADSILRNFLPRLLEMQIYQAVLESNASEHSSRMLAMRNASDSAGGLLADLTLGFNKARQAGITQEIAEISVSKAAME